jgi:hypothetical protein
VKDLDNECLLANLSETLALADAMLSDLALIWMDRDVMWHGYPTID